MILNITIQGVFSRTCLTYFFYQKVCQNFFEQIIFSKWNIRKNAKNKKVCQKVCQTHFFNSELQDDSWYDFPIRKIGNFIWEKAKKWGDILLGKKVCQKKIVGSLTLNQRKYGKSLENTGFSRLLCGSPCWTRTNDTAVNSRMLYRLS